MEPVHIRRNGGGAACCGREGGSISLRHAIEQPEHASTLPLCGECVLLAVAPKPDAIAPERLCDLCAEGGSVAGAEIFGPWWIRVCPGHWMMVQMIRETARYVAAARLAGSSPP